MGPLETLVVNFDFAREKIPIILSVTEVSPHAIYKIGFVLKRF